MLDRIEGVRCAVVVLLVKRLRSSTPQMRYHVVHYMKAFQGNIRGDLITEMHSGSLLNV